RARSARKRRTSLEPRFLVSSNARLNRTCAMIRAPRQWSLPGPSEFVRSVTQIANENGIVAVIAPPRFFPQLDAALENGFGQHWLPNLRANADEAPLTALSRGFNVEVRSAAKLPTDRAIEGRVLIVEGIDGTAWPRWETTLRAWCAACA